MILLSTYHAYDKAVRKLMLIKPNKFSGASKSFEQPYRDRTYSIRSFTGKLKERTPRRNATTYTGKPRVPCKPARLKNFPRAATASQFCSSKPTEASGAASSKNSQDSPCSKSIVAEYSVLLSLGGAYRGVLGRWDNCPSDFMLPTLKATTAEAKAGSMTSHLLLWSTERNKQGKTLEQTIFDLSNEALIEQDEYS